MALVKAGGDEIYVLKKMNRQYLQAKQVYKQILRERLIMGYFDHPNVCKLYSTYKTSLSLCMLIEPCMGGELYTYMRNVVSR